MVFSESIVYLKFARLQCGLQGLECYYSRYNREEIDFLLQQARKHHLFISGGSDYHGKI